MSDRERELEQGRRLADSLRRAAQIAEGDGAHDLRSGPRVLPHENEGFRDGVEAERHLRENICPNGASPYGPYVPPPRRGVSLEEKGELVEFLPHHVALFRVLTAERAGALGRHAIRLTERETVGKWWRRAWKLGLAVVVATFAAARWGLDQLPMVQTIVHWFRGNGS